MLDLHCHILPGVDDGAPDMDAAVNMARALAAVGFSGVAASPHMGEGPGGDVPIDEAARVRGALAERLRGEGVDLNLLPNGEHHVTPELGARMDRGAVVPVGGEGRWLLVELPWHPIPMPENVLFRMQLKGYKLLLAHPERYQYIEVEAAERLADRGIKLQLELGSFVGMYGRRAAGRAHRLLERGAAHVLATDLHQPARASEWLPQALEEVRARYGEEAAALGLRDNPRAIVQDAAADGLVPMIRVED